MAEETRIGWCHHTQNFWWGCHKVSPECTNCYIDIIMRRAGKQPFNGPMITQTWAQSMKWNAAARRAKQRRRVFTCSMSDFFHAGADSWRPDAWDIIRVCRELDWLILTKRPERIAECLPADWGDGWPNVWLGVTAGVESSLHRVDTLAATPAALRFVSAEPILEPLDFTRWFGYTSGHGSETERNCCLQCGYQWRIGDRKRRLGMAGCATEGQPLGGRHKDSSVRAETGRASRSGGLPASASDAGRRANTLPGSSSRVAPSSRRDSRRTDDQSSERRSRRQPSRKSGTGDAVTAATALHTGAENSELPEPAWGAQPELQADRCPSCGDPQTAIRRGNCHLDSRGVWSQLPARIKTVQTAAPLISWLICGGESGPKRRNSEVDWYQSLCNQCQLFDVPFYMKQDVALLDGQQGRIPDRLWTIKQFPKAPTC